MGGGAGIKWTVEFDDCLQVEVSKSGVAIAKAPKILRFDANGYDDGMISVRGDLLEAHDWKVSWGGPDGTPCDWEPGMRRHFDWDARMKMVAEADFDRESDHSAMIWRGFTRGTAEGVSFDLNGYADIYSGWVGEVWVHWSCGVRPNPQRMEEYINWFDRVFEAWKFIDEMEEDDWQDHSFRLDMEYRYR